MGGVHGRPYDDGHDLNEPGRQTGAVVPVPRMTKVLYPCEQCPVGEAVLMEHTVLRYWCLRCAMKALREGRPVQAYTELRGQCREYGARLERWRAAMAV